MYIKPNSIHINNYLENGAYPIANFERYREVVTFVCETFARIFGTEIMTKYPIYIDNATRHGGAIHTIKPLFNKVIIIKTGISDGHAFAIDTAFQMAYNLTYYVFYSKFGMTQVPPREYTDYCIAMAITFVWASGDEILSDYERRAIDKYPQGVELARNNDYDIVKLSELILDYDFIAEGKDNVVEFKK